MSLFPTLLRGSLLERKGRVWLAVAAIAIGTSVAAALLLVSRDVGAKVAHELRVYGPNAMLAAASPTSQASFGASARTWLETERRAGRIASFATLRYGVARAQGQVFVLAATDPADLRALYPGWRFEGPADAEAVLGADVARRLGVAAGSATKFEVPDGATAHTLSVARVATVSTGGAEDRVVFVSRTALQSATGQDAAPFQLALARIDGPAERVLAYTTAAHPPGAGVSLRAIKQLSAADGDVLARLRKLLLTVTAVALLAAILCAMSTLADLVLERTREVALLRSLGAGRRDVLALFAGEAVVIGLLGGVFGLAIGILAAQAIGRGVFGTAIAIAPIVLPMTLGLGVLTALVASLVPVQHALAIEPAPVLRGE